MKKTMAELRLRPFVAVAAIVLSAGLLIDALLVGSGLSEVRSLRARRDTLSRQLATNRATDEEYRELGRVLPAAVPPADAEERPEDPLATLGRAVSLTGLQGASLAAGSISSAPRTRRQSFSLEAEGRYDQIVRFVRMVEGGSKLISIDAISIAASEGGSLLECRVDLSIHQRGAGRPRGGRR